MAIATVRNPFPLTNKKITDSILEYARKSQEYLYSQFNMRDRLEYLDRSYQREDDLTEEQWKARLAVRQGDKRRRTNVTVPIVMPQVESALGYFTEVFLTGYPLFGVGSPPEFDDAALQMETLMAEHSLTANWPRHLMMFFRDGLKYNFHGMEVDWAQEVTAAIEQGAGLDNKQGKPKEVVWNGNKMRRMDLYNTVFDPRVAPAEIHSKGEFAGYVELYSRIALKQLINSMFRDVPQAIALKAMESGTTSGSISKSYKDLGYYIPVVNPDSLIDRESVAEFDWMAWATDTAKGKIRYKNVYEVFKLYARIIPSDFDLYVPQENTPQIWKFLIVNNSVLLAAERCTNAHNNLPIIFGQPIEDGLGYQTKSFAQNVIPFQDLASAAINANIASKRRLVMDRIFYDPTRIREADINSDNPSAKIPVRPGAYGKPIGEAFSQVPYRDDLSANVTAESELYVRYANITNGQNPAQQGQFVKGNKTRHEFADVMSNSNSRNRMMALLSEYQVLQPIKEILKINILQYQTEETIYNREKQLTVKIDPIVLRQAVSAFKVSDGILPSDKLLNTEEFNVAVQVLGSTPALAARYRMDQVFSHLFKQRGVDLSPFEKTEAELQYEQALLAWQQAAALAAEKGAAFNTPMPQAPAPELVRQQVEQMRKQKGVPLQTLVEAAIAGSSAVPGTAGTEL